MARRRWVPTYLLGNERGGVCVRVRKRAAGGGGKEQGRRARTGIGDRQAGQQRDLHLIGARCVLCLFPPLFFGPFSAFFTYLCPDKYRRGCGGVGGLARRAEEERKEEEERWERRVDRLSIVDRAVLALNKEKKRNKPPNNKRTEQPRERRTKKGNNAKMISSGPKRKRRAALPFGRSIDLLVLFALDACVLLICLLVIPPQTITQRLGTAIADFSEGIIH